MARTERPRLGDLGGARGKTTAVTHMTSSEGRARVLSVSTRHGAGEPCPCLPGLVCDEAQCKKPGALGEPCPCLSPLTCANGACQPPLLPCP